MTFRVETVEEKQSILIVSKQSSLLVQELKKELTARGADVFLSPYLPRKTQNFDLCFLVNQEGLLESTEISSMRKVVFLLTEKPFSLDRWHRFEKKLHHKHNIKIVNIDGNVFTKEDIDKILWFAFSTDVESLLSLHVRREKRNNDAKVKWFHTIRIGQINRKKNVIFVVFTIIFIHLAFVPFLLISFFHLQQSIFQIKQERLTQGQKETETAITYARTAKSLYSFSRPTLLLFSVALPIDTLFSVNDDVTTALSSSYRIYESGKSFVELLMKKDKNQDEKKEIVIRIDLLKKEINTMQDAVTSLNQTIPSYLMGKELKGDLVRVTDMLSKVKRILPYADRMLAKGTTKRYLILFANNMELRPGGGFIGSFGILTVRDFTVEDLKVYDVYDADGQLDVHVDPPQAIRDYLHQPHFFLRDSAFYPDFSQTYEKAMFFLNREMKMNDFDGGILITTTAIEHFLGAFGDIYLPDFKEMVNQKNFYIKAQIHSEKDFFPGSIQKKGFLSALARYIFLHAQDVSPKILGRELLTVLDEKQMVVFLKDADMQRVFDSYYWSGRQIEPRCSESTKNCIMDYFYTLDANLGVNKANFFVKKNIDLQTLIDQNGALRHTLTLHYENESPAEVFPGGTYKNYLQIVLPPSANVEMITKDGTLIEKVDEKTTSFKTVGFYIEIQPKKTTDVKISYRLGQSLKKGKGLYQLVVQKQIGAANNDIALGFRIPTNITLLNQNFSPLVNGNHLNYNTILTSDKIFFIDVVKQ